MAGKGTIGLSGKAALLEGGREDFKGQSAYTAGRAFDQMIYQSQRNDAGESIARTGRAIANAADKVSGALVDWAVEKEKAENAINVAAVKTDMELEQEKIKQELGKSFVGEKSGGGEAFVRSSHEQFISAQRERIEKITDPKLRAELEGRLKVAGQRLITSAVENDIHHTGKILTDRYNEAAAVFKEAVRRDPMTMKDEALRESNGAYSAITSLEDQMARALGVPADVLKSRRERMLADAWQTALEVDTARTLDAIATGGKLDDARRAANTLFKEYEGTPIHEDKRYEMKLKIDNAIKSEQDRREYKARMDRSEERQDLQFQYQAVKAEVQQAVSTAKSTAVPPSEREAATKNFRKLAEKEFDIESRIAGTYKGNTAKSRQELADTRAKITQEKVDDFTRIMDTFGGGR